MPPTKLGTLVVVVLKARNLPNPSLYKQSPYMLVRLGGGGKRTKIDEKGGQHPVWDEDLHFEIYPQDPNEPRVLRLTCLVEGRGRMDESIGDGELRVEDVLKRGEFDGWVPLSLNGTQRGEVYLELTFFVNAQALGRRPSKLGPSERLWRPSPPASPSGSNSPNRPSTSHSQVSAGSPGRAPLNLPPSNSSPSRFPAAGSSPGQTRPLALPPRQDPAPAPGSRPTSGQFLPPPSPRPAAAANANRIPAPAQPAPEYYDPFAYQAPSQPRPNEQASPVPQRPSSALPPDDAPMLGSGVPAALRPGPAPPTQNHVPFLDVAATPPAPQYSNAPPLPLPARNAPSSGPVAAPPPVRQEPSALAAQRLVWEERDRRKKQEEEDEAFARQLMAEEEEAARGTDRDGRGAGGQHIPGGWTD